MKGKYGQRLFRFKVNSYLNTRSYLLTCTSCKVESNWFCNLLELVASTPAAPKPTASFLSLYNYGPQSPGRKGFWPRGFSSFLFVLRRRTSSSTSAIVLSRCGCSEVCGSFSSILSEMSSTSCLFFSDFPPTLFIIHFSGGSLKFVMMFSWMSYLHACHMSICF